MWTKHRILDVFKEKVREVKEGRVREPTILGNFPNLAPLFLQATCSYSGPTILERSTFWLDYRLEQTECKFSQH